MEKTEKLILWLCLGFLIYLFWQIGRISWPFDLEF